MSNRYGHQRPPYPLYTLQADGGDLQPPSFSQPPDIRFNSISVTNPSYSVYGGTYGRFLAGLGQEDGGVPAPPPPPTEPPPSEPPPDYDLMINQAACSLALGITRIMWGGVGLAGGILVGRMLWRKGR